MEAVLSEQGGRSISVLCVLPKHERRVRLPPPAPNINPQLPMKKSSKSLFALIAFSLATAGYVFAADKVENKVAGCCAKAAGEGKVCAHACCVEAAKAGDNCTKCKGSGKIMKKSEAKK